MDRQRTDAWTLARHGVIAACAIALVFAIGAWLGRASLRDHGVPASAAPAPAPAESHVVARAPKPPDAPAPPRVSTPSLPSLPTAGTPIAVIHDELVARARGGDAAAAMRLAIDLRLCTAWEPPYPGFDVEAYPGVKQRLARRAVFCEDLPPERVLTAEGWLLRAAELGDTGAMVCFAANPDAYALPVMSERWIEWVRQWREKALPFAVRAYEAGDVSALRLFATAYGPRVNGLSRDAFGALVEPDPVRAAVHAAMLTKLRNNDSTPSAPGAWPDLDAMQADTANRMFLRDWPRFAGRSAKVSTVCPHASVLR